MKVLQLSQNNKALQVPKILELGHGLTADFNTITFDTEFDQIVLVDTQPHRSYQKTDGRNYDYELRIVEQYNIICNLRDCYQSRPLFELDGHCEFDVLIYTDEGIEYEYIFVFHPTKKTFGLLTNQGQDSKYFIPINSELYKDYGNPTKTQGSIFTNENQRKYPKLLKKALGLIN